MRVLVTRTTGFAGHALTDNLIGQGIQVLVYC